MALPNNVRTFVQPIDPSDVLDFYVRVSRDGADDSTLQGDENITAYTIALTPESIAAGLELINDSANGYVTRLENFVIVFYARLATNRALDPSFSGSGTSLGIEITLTTDAVPVRKKQRTVAIKVAQQ